MVSYLILLVGEEEIYRMPKQIDSDSSQYRALLMKRNLKLFRIKLMDWGENGNQDKGNNIESG